MSKSRLPSTIRAAFPLLSDDEITRLLMGLAPQSPVGVLTSSNEADSAFERMAVWMLQHPARSFGTCLPGLWLVRDEAIRDAGLSGRVVKALSQLRILVWGDLLELAPSILLDIQEFKEGNLQQFLAAMARISADACCRGTPPTRCPVVDVFEQRRFPPKLSLRMSEFHSLVDWASNEAQAKTVGDLVAACQRADIPEDIALLRESIQNLHLNELVSIFERNDYSENLITDLCEILDHRSRRIFLSRISLSEALTLESLAGELGITRERVRQLHVKAESTIRAALRTQRFAPVAWRAHTLAGLLGVAVPRDTGFLDQSIQQATRGVSGTACELVTEVLLWLAGPYCRDSATGWLRSGEIPSQSVVSDCSTSLGQVDIDRVRQVLSEYGLVRAVHDAWIDQLGKVKQIQGVWLMWTGSVPDKAARLLELWGEPATPEHLVNAIGEGHDVRATRSRLLEDERMMRVDMTRIGLRSWGMEEYSGIADEIDQELEQRGGTSDVGDLIVTLGERFGLSESSIRSYLSVPLFVLQGKLVRRRTITDRFPPVAPVTDTAGCYLLGQDALSWRIEVNADTLRGSGRMIPSSIAGWLGVTPGNQRVLEAEGGTVRITWPMTSTTGPALGSIRFLAEKVDAQPSDQLLITIRRDVGTIHVSKLDTAAVNASQGFERLALLTGIPNGDSEAAFLHRLGAAVGVSGTRAAVSAELRQRGEGTLASLVPAEQASPELDAVIDSLKDLF